MMREKNRMELNMNEMDQVGGGYVLGRGINYDAWIVDDITGEKIGSAPTVGKAQWASDDMGVSHKVITPKEYIEMFNKDPYSEQ